MDDGAVVDLATLIHHVATIDAIERIRFMTSVLRLAVRQPLLEAKSLFSVAHRAYLLQRGRVVRSGPAEELAANLDELEAGYFGEGPAPSSAST